MLLSLAKANITSLSHPVGLHTNTNVCTSFFFATVSSSHLNSLVIGQDVRLGALPCHAYAPGANAEPLLIIIPTTKEMCHYHQP